MTNNIQYQATDIERDTLRHLYRSMLKPRMIEEKMLVLLRQGKISKWFSGIGQEAIAIGVTSALHKEEYILPMHRNLGVFTTRERRGNCRPNRLQLNVFDISLFGLSHDPFHFSGYQEQDMDFALG